MNANSAIKAATSASVSIVSIIAAVISYSHIYHVAIGHGQTRLDSSLLPFSVDGLIAAASLTLFYASRNRLDSPLLARVMLGLGVGATIAVNAVFGISSGVLGILLSAWPALAFIGSVELILWVIRAATATAGTAPLRTGRGTHKRTDTGNEVRRWARDQGYEISNRGRVPQVIQDAYAAAATTNASDQEQEQEQELFIPESFETQADTPRIMPGPRGTGAQL